MKTIPSLIFLFSLLVVSCTTSGDQEAVQTPATAEAAVISYNGDFKGPLGLQLWSLGSDFEKDVPGTMARVKAMGFKHVELAGTYGWTPEDFRAELDKNGLDATAMHADYERFEEDLEGIFADAKILGAEMVGIPWIPHEDPYTVAMAREAVADFNAWGEAAAEHGLSFFYHPHGYEFQPDENGVLPIDVLIQETNPEYVDFEIDVYWTYLPGVDPAAFLRKYPDRFKLMHIKDMKKDYEDYPNHTGGSPAEAKVVIGTGQIDFAAVLEAAQEIGLMHFYLEDETPNSMENIPPSIDYLETITF